MISPSTPFPPSNAAVGRKRGRRLVLALAKHLSPSAASSSSSSTLTSGRPWTRTDVPSGEPVITAPATDVVSIIAAAAVAVTVTPTPGASQTSHPKSRGPGTTVVKPIETRFVIFGLRDLGADPAPPVSAWGWISSVRSFSVDGPTTTKAPPTAPIGRVAPSPPLLDDMLRTEATPPTSVLDIPPF